MSEQTSGELPEELKPKDKQPHDVLAGAERASLHPNGRQRMTAIFDTVFQQIAFDIQRAKQTNSVEEAVAIFEATAREYAANRSQIIDKLDRLVTQ